MRCSICNEKIEKTFLDKIKGTYYNLDGELYPICPKCQKKNDKREIKEKINR